jgi:hypothetical protein
MYAINWAYTNKFDNHLHISMCFFFLFWGSLLALLGIHTYWLCSLCQLWQSSHQKNVKIWNVSWSSQKKKWTQKQTLDEQTSKCERHVRPNEIYIDPWSNPWRQDCQSIDNHSHVGVFVSSSHGNGHLNFFCWAFNVWKVHYCEHLAPLTNPQPGPKPSSMLIGSNLQLLNQSSWKCAILSHMVMNLVSAPVGFFKQISACS